MVQPWFSHGPDTVYGSHGPGSIATNIMEIRFLCVLFIHRSKLLLLLFLFMRTKGSSIPIGSLSCSKIVEIRDVAGWERLSLNPVANHGTKRTSIPFGSLSCSKIVGIRNVAGGERSSLNPVANCRIKGSSFPVGSLACSKIVEISDVAGGERSSLNPSCCES